MRKVCKLLPAIFVLGATVATPAFGADARTTYKIDSAKSRIEIHVAKDGFLKAFGHDHLISATKFSGEVKVNTAKMEDSAVSFSADSAALKVIDPGESEKDRNEVQATMLGTQVLDVARFPQIDFSSTAVKVSSSSGGKFELQVTGILTLHGTQKPITLPAHVQIADDGALACDTEISFLQSEFGITPYKAAGGAVRVKDKVTLAFHIVAQKSSN